ncbi:uncharacterized protein LOC143585498 [Bidens hawaiensis]|uniref:uncharacterized protein LOC143585498 n=1 Tax=Bidens hawaiensis TaxID=980011 RepID=UPI00404A8CC5
MMRSLWDKMQSALSIPQCTCLGCECEGKKKMSRVRDKEQLYEFLMGLDNKFSVIRTQILAMNPISTLRNAYHLVHDDENQRAINSKKRAPTEPSAFKAFMHGKCDNNTAPKRDKPPASNDVVAHCTFCERDGHNRDSFFKRIGYPQWWPGNKKHEEDKKRDDAKPKAACIDSAECPIPGLTKDQYNTFLNFFAENCKATNGNMKRMACMESKIKHNNDWVIDSGSTEHITHNIEMLQNRVITFNEEPIVIPKTIHIR